VVRLRGRLEIVSDERIRLSSTSWWWSSGRARMWFLVRTGLAEEFLPEFAGPGLEQDPIHRHKDVLATPLR